MQSPSPLHVVWVSSAYSAGQTLTYYSDILRTFTEQFPKTVVPVARTTDVQPYVGVPLVPMLTFHHVGRTTRTVGTVAYTSMRRVPTLATLWRLTRLPADVYILIEFGPTSLGGFLVSQLRRRPFLLLIESDPSYRGAPQHRAVRMLKRFVARRAACVQVSNAIGERFVIDELKVRPSRVFTGPYLTSVPDPEPAAPQGDERVRLLFLNSITPRKGVAELLRALAAMTDGAQDRRETWHLDVVGDGPDRVAMQELADTLGLSTNVTFHGRCLYREIGRHYAAADVVVSPSLADYRSLSGFEAVNAARPVLISRYDGAHEELLRLAPAARMIDPLDTAQFSAALATWLLDPEALAAAKTQAATPPRQFTAAAIQRNLATAVLRTAGQAEPLASD